MPKTLARIEHHCRYFQDGPDNVVKRRSVRPSEFESILMFRRVYATKRGESVEVDSVRFTGNSRDEADGRMLAWIEENGAVEADFENK